MQSVKEVIVVEGRYDKNTLLQVVDAVVIETSGFGIFNDSQKQKLLRTMAEKRGLIILTDPDGAGFVIRNFIKSCIPAEQLKQAYVPDIPGKERAGATFEGEEADPNIEKVTKADLYRIGLAGREESAKKRAALIRSLDLPEHLSADALLNVVNAIMSREDFFSRAAHL